MHEKHIEIRWRDLDALGHVNNAVYLTYLEELRGSWATTLFDDPDALSAFVLARVAIDFRSEVRLAERRLLGRVAVTRIGTSSLTLRESLHKGDGTIAAESEAVLVMRDAQTGRSRPITEAERAALERALEPT
ncbi:MAG: thioesterase family protein [Thermoleophilia bacterium]